MTVYLVQLINDYGYNDKDIYNLGIVSDYEMVKEIKNKFEHTLDVYSEICVTEFVLDSLDLSGLI